MVHKFVLTVRERVNKKEGRKKIKRREKGRSSFERSDREIVE
jgi:hypothetical protein